MPIGVCAARNRRVSIQAPAVSYDALGQEQFAWSTVATVWARVRNTSTNEQTNADRTVAVASHVIETQWPMSLVSVDSTMRVVMGARVFNVLGTRNPGGLDRTLLIHCFEQIPPPPDAP